MKRESSFQLNAGVVASLGGLFLSGAMMNISMLDIPILLAAAQNDSHQLADHWARIYELGSQLYPSLCAGVSLLHLWDARSRRAAGQPRWWAPVVAAVLSMAIAPFTWAIMSPTNDALFRARALGVAAAVADVRELLVRWRWLHFVRSLLPLAGAVLGVSEAKILVGT